MAVPARRKLFPHLSKMTLQSDLEIDRLFAEQIEAIIV